MLPGWFETPESGSPFFENETITLADHEQQVLSIRMQVTKFYATFDLEIDYVIGSSSTIHNVIVNDHGEPFQLTGLRFGNNGKSASYEEAFNLQGNFSLCQLVDPRVIPLNLMGAKCR